MAHVLTAGQRHEQTVFAPLLDAGAVKRPGRGRPAAPRRAAGDQGYTSRPVRRALRRRGIGAVIPRRATSAPDARLMGGAIASATGWSA